MNDSQTVTSDTEPSEQCDAENRYIRRTHIHAYIHIQNDNFKQYIERDTLDAEL